MNKFDSKTQFHYDYISICCSDEFLAKIEKDLEDYPDSTIIGVDVVGSSNTFTTVYLKSALFDVITIHKEITRENDVELSRNVLGFKDVKFIMDAMQQ